MLKVRSECVFVSNNFKIIMDSTSSMFSRVIFHNASRRQEPYPKDQINLRKIIIKYEKYSSINAINNFTCKHVLSSASLINLATFSFVKTFHFFPLYRTDLLFRNGINL